MSQAIPVYLDGKVFNVKRDDYLRADVRSSGGEYFEIYYYGELFKSDDNTYIVDLITDEEIIPCKVVAVCVKTGEEILLFDGYKHGYNAMFCDEFDKQKAQNRTLVKFDIAPSKIHLKFGYSIDYDEEKDEYEIDERGGVKLINGDVISWDEVKANGFDYIAVTCENEDGEAEIVSLELA